MIYILCCNTFIHFHMQKQYSITVNLFNPSNYFAFCSSLIQTVTYFNRFVLCARKQQYSIYAHSNEELPPTNTCASIVSLYTLHQRTMWIERQRFMCNRLNNFEHSISFVSLNHLLCETTLDWKRKKEQDTQIFGLQTRAPGYSSEVKRKNTPIHSRKSQLFVLIRSFS